jgi:hypothetical protein
MFFLFKRRRYCYCFNIILIVFVVFFFILQLPRSHFNTEQNENLRISGRISTATLGNDDQPMNVFQSFNKSKDRKQESSAESEKTILKFDDTKDEAL